MKFPSLNDRRLAEFIGIMLGDGCMGIYDSRDGKRTKTQYQVKVTLDSRERDFSKYVLNLMKLLFQIEPRVSYKKNENTVDIRTFRKGVLNFLVERVGLELSPKVNSARIPERFIGNNLELYVLRGLFDTDGSVVLTKNNGILYPRLELRICPSPMQEQVIEILERREFDFKVQKLDGGKIRVRLNGRKELGRWLRVVGTSNLKHVRRGKRILKNSAGWI